MNLINRSALFSSLARGPPAFKASVISLAANLTSPQIPTSTFLDVPILLPSASTYVYNIRVVATTPEKTHNQKFLTFETIFNRFFVQFYPGFKKKKKKKKKKLPPLYIDQLKCGIRPPPPPTLPYSPPPPDAFWGTTL